MSVGTRRKRTRRGCRARLTRCTDCHQRPSANTTPFWWGSSITQMQANYGGNPLKPDPGNRTVPVDSLEPNPWGLYNVHGNVWEWTEDCWNDSNTGNPGDGRARTTGNCGPRVVRGGSWYGDPRFLR